MRMIIVKAVFIGKDGSCGYRNNKEYTLKLLETKGSFQVQLYAFGPPQQVVRYSSIITLLDNWKNISKVD